MLPLGHAAFGYLLYVGYAAASSHRVPARWALLPLAFGTQFPDLVDKPLAFVGVLPYGRSLAHSVFTFVIVTALVWWAGRRLADRWRGTDHGWWDRLRVVTPGAFAVGYASHLLGDASDALLAGQFADAHFLLYPLFVLPDSPSDDVAPWVRLLDIYGEMETHPQLELILLAVLVFVGIRIRAYVLGRYRRAAPE